ncbi:alpha/beta fold hydrolase [Naumannella sp. ID2617S]|nr:alpha/beta fold hydrolase [Naumannella sp. ID2617S]
MTVAEPLVLLPGMNCTEQLWRPMLDRLGADREVFTPVVDGSDLTDAVGRLLAALPPRFALAGLSLGGIVAMALHRHAPQRISRLALLDTNALAPTAAQQSGWQRALDRLGDGLDARAYQAEILGLLVAPGHEPALADTVLQMGEQTGAALLGRQLRIQQTRVDELPGLGRVAVPTLVLHGELDQLCPAARHQEIAGAVAGSTLVQIPGAGHLSPLEAPDRVAVALREWLAG